jgi:hypothetical protein
MRPYLKNTHKKGLEAWLKWWNTCLASVRPGVQTPVSPNKTIFNGDSCFRTFDSMHTQLSFLLCPSCVSFCKNRCVHTCLFTLLWGIKGSLVCIFLYFHHFWYKCLHAPRVDRNQNNIFLNNYKHHQIQKKMTLVEPIIRYLLGIFL